jgi:hypothetical protein
MNNYHDDLVLRAIRIAEHTHGTRPKGIHYSKAPAGKDRPFYFVHLAEVAWMLADTGCNSVVVAAGYTLTRS